MIGGAAEVSKYETLYVEKICRFTSSHHLLTGVSVPSNLLVEGGYCGADIGYDIRPSRTGV